MRNIRILIKNIRDGFKNVIRNFSLSLASISCITVTLLIVAFAIVGSYNVENFTKVIRDDFTIVVYMNNSNTEETEAKIKDEIKQVTQGAVTRILEMKNIEGEKISQDLLQRIRNIQSKIVEISAKSTGLIEEYVVKLEKRVKELLKNDEVDKSRLAQEVVIYADKCSIEEEVTRLNSHISQFKNLLNSNEAIGKKLDFIIQEMNRETNTIGSKANNLEITNGVIDIKTEIENIREQVQNIE